MRRNYSADSSKANPKRIERVSLAVSVYGAGAWGTALAIVLADAGSEVLLVARDEQQAAEIERGVLRILRRNAQGAEQSSQE